MPEQDDYMPKGVFERMVSPEDVGDAYRDADDIFERVFEAVGLPSFNGT